MRIQVREGQVSSLLDLIITRDKEVVTNIEYLSLGKSDYLLLKIETVFETGECVKKQHLSKLAFKQETIQPLEVILRR